MTNNGWQTVYTEEKGLCLVATQDFSPLEIVLHDEAAVAVPYSIDEESCIVCLQELEDEEIIECQKCHYFLCSSKCIEIHGLECPILAKRKEQEEFEGRALALLRMLSLKIDSRPSWKNIDKLMDHSRERKLYREAWERDQNEIVKVVSKLIDHSINDEEVDRLLGIFDCNSISLTSTRDGLSGQALFPTLSLVNHSCVANCRFVVNPETLSVVLKAKRQISSGEELTINYSHPIYGAPKRKEILARKWFFSCNCLRCSDVTEFGTNISALKCSHCREGLILPESTSYDSLWRCRFCSNPFESEFIGGLVLKLENNLFDLFEGNPSVKSVESYIRENSKDLHSKHYLILIAQRHIINLLAKESKMTREAAKKIIRLGKAFKSTLAPLDRGYSEWLGFALKNINLAQLEILKLDLKEKKINKNAYAEESEAIWKSMKEVEKCEALCSPVKHMAT